MALESCVAFTKPLAEYQARDHLKAKAIECLLPSVSTPSPRRRREDTPLFPGYLFIQYDLQEWGTRPLRLGQGLIGLVMFDGVAPSVPDELIEELQQRIADINGWGGLWTRYKEGDPVMVRLAPQGSESFAEVVAGAQSPQGRVQVLLEFLGRQAHAEVPWLSLRSADDEEIRLNGTRFRRRTRGK